MRQASARLIEAIADGGTSPSWVFDLMYDNNRRLANVPIERGPALDWDASRFVVGSGSARIVWTDDHATSLVPREIGDWFSPFGAELQVDCVIGAGVFAERVAMGRFIISEIPNAQESAMLWEGRLVHPGESFTVSLKDRLAKVQRDDFALPSAPRSSSVWDELQSITGLPLARTVADASVGSIAYEGSKEEAVKALFDRLNAWPQMDSAGALSARSKSWPDPVGVLVNVVAAQPTMTSQDTYNRVVVKGRNADGDPLYGVREVKDGYLRVRNPDGSASPFGGATYSYADNLGVLDTQAKVDAYAEALLPRVSRRRSVTREVIEPFNPLREVGDVLTFADRSAYGAAPVRVQRISHRGGETVMQVEVPDA